MLIDFSTWLIRPSLQDGDKNRNFITAAPDSRHFVSRNRLLDWLTTWVKNVRRASALPSILTTWGTCVIVFFICVMTWSLTTWQISEFRGWCSLLIDSWHWWAFTEQTQEETLRLNPYTCIKKHVLHFILFTACFIWLQNLLSFFPLFLLGEKNIYFMRTYFFSGVCVCVCVCEREREREGGCVCECVSVWVSEWERERVRLCVCIFVCKKMQTVLLRPVLTNISLLIIPCMIVYVTNNKEPWTLNLEL